VKRLMLLGALVGGVLLALLTGTLVEEHDAPRRAPWGDLPDPQALAPIAAVVEISEGSSAEVFAPARTSRAPCRGTRVLSGAKALLPWPLTGLTC